MSIIFWIDINTIDIDIVKVCDGTDIILIDLPISILEYLNTTRVNFFHIWGIFTSSCKQLVVYKLHFKEMINFRTTRIECAHYRFVFLQTLIFIVFRQRCRIFRMWRCIGACYFSFLHVYLYVAKWAVQPSIDTINYYFFNGFIICHRLVVDGRDIDDFTWSIY